MAGKLSYHKNILLVLACLVSFSLTAFPARAQAGNDDYITGYADALLRREFNIAPGNLRVNNGVAALSAREIKNTDIKKVIDALLGIEGITRVEIMDPDKEKIYTSNRRIFPKGQLFQPLIADPRWPHFSSSLLNYSDKAELKTVGSTSFGETFNIYRNKACFNGLWQIGIQAAVFAIFDLDAESKDLVNADYFVGIPVSYRKKSFSSILRVFHQSSHLGDEYLLRSRSERINLSYEGADVKLSYEFRKTIRLYAGAGYLFHRYPSALKPGVIHCGIEIQSPRSFLNGCLRPVAAADFKSLQEHQWNNDKAFRAGVQLESNNLDDHRIQLTLEYFKGHSPNGQFYTQSIKYRGIGLHFYF